MNIEIRSATSQDVDQATALVADFHVEEGVEQAPDIRREAVATLIANPSFGGFRFIESDGAVIGYLAFALGYSIEFNGRDAFLDEIFVVPAHRGRGAGRRAIRALKAELQALGVKAAHLEVAAKNPDAQRLYEREGFEMRRGYHLMSARLDLK